MINFDEMNEGEARGHLLPVGACVAICGFYWAWGTLGC